MVYSQISRTRQVEVGDGWCGSLGICGVDAGTQLWVMRARWSLDICGVMEMGRKRSR